MRRAGSSSGARAVSPTNTSYSGISNYRTDSYRPSQAQSAPQDARQIAKAHYEELSKYLASYLANEPANSRSAARQKLTRLTRQQFQELSTDVYDELIRRKNNADSNDIPFLPVRDDFHPKRNQARQKLATLPTSRFKDLSSDVYYELVRRYPEFKEQEAVDEPVNSPGSTYDDYPSPDFPAASRSSHTDSPSTITGTQASAPAHRSNGSYSSSIPRTSIPSSPPLPPTPYTAASNAEDYASTGPVPRTSREAYPSTPFDPTRARMMQDDYTPAGTSSRRRPSDDYSVGSRRRPSEDFASVGRRPSASSNGTGASGTSANMATSGMIIPAKSTIAEEEIEVPFARRGQDDGEDGDHDQDDDAGYAGPGRRLRSLSGDLSPESASDGDDDRRQYFDRMSTSRGSTTSERAIRSGSDRDRGARASAGGADGEKVRREYEFRIATMQSKIVGLEREAEERTSVIEEYRRQAQEEAAERSRDADELARLRERCRELEMQLENGENRRGSKGPDHDAIAIIEQLRSDTENLLAELSDVSARGEEMVLARETDAEVIRGLEHEVREWKKKYEAAKTELRSVKATSQLYTPKPSFADNLSVAPNGSIRDSHVTSFLTSIDALLTAGRSNNPAQVLEPLKAVVDSVSAILDDFRVSVREGGFTQPSRIEDFDSLQDRAEATLGNLVATAKTHATSAGLAPVSLLDAAASHIAVVITDINKIAYNHRIAQGDYDHTTSKILPTSASAWISSQRSVDDGNHGHHRRDHSRASSSSRHAAAMTRRPRSTRTDDGSSFENGTSPLPLGLAQANRTEAGASPIGHGTSEEAWAELKPYLEAQTESIVYAIQSVLSGVRSPTPSSTLTENLTQIITIVSSIVAVCSDALSPGNTQGHDILHDLSEHANKLSEMQALTDVTKESRQVMAKSSFAIANAMKALQKL